MNSPCGIALDLTHGEIWIANSSANSVLVFPVNQNGATAPIRTIIGSTAESILVYNRTANGDVSPVASDSGTSTFLERPLGLAISP